ncbi:hypothetical protein D3C72_2302310 [compost metagenome]
MSPVFGFEELFLGLQAHQDRKSSELGYLGRYCCLEFGLYDYLDLSGHFLVQEQHLEYCAVLGLHLNFDRLSLQIKEA